ncbi:MAG TPA: hypothetical protein VK997_08250, partial [Deferrisomatales bacterium]|nr:hypothetical protein [Deferrisomatales bacterium]
VVVRCEAKGRYLRLLPLCLLTGLGVFALVNYPLFQDTNVFRRGLGFEIQHAMLGHDVVIRPQDFWFGFHLTQSIVPGITLLLTLPALGGMCGSLWGWRRAPDQDRLLLVYSLLFYCAAEISPLKPFPDAMRYVIPIVPALLFFAVKGIRGILVRATPKRSGLQIGLTAAALLYPGWDAVQLVRNLPTDTRAAAARWVAERNTTALFESYASAEPGVKYAPDGLRFASPRYLVTSSFMYDRFFLGAALGGQSPSVREKHREYQELFTLPFHEIVPAYKSFAFSNPTLRIVDVSSLQPRTRPRATRGRTGSSGPRVTRPPPGPETPGRP